jgi:photosystem II stability/assembly factor-like uncharacterized protein
VAAHSAIVADGRAGYEADTHDCIGNDVRPDGDVGSGVYRSNDGGQSWTHVGGSGFPLHAWVYALAVSPFDGRLVYVPTLKGLYRTSDAGTTWHEVSGPGCVAFFAGRT